MEDALQPRCFRLRPGASVHEVLDHISVLVSSPMQEELRFRLSMNSTRPVNLNGLPLRRIGTNNEARGTSLHVSVLSSGTQGTPWNGSALWPYDNGPSITKWREGWEKKPAILLIDEIENHLHPTWQRRVIPALLEHFPGLQIFATTHSPFVVAGLKGRAGSPAETRFRERSRNRHHQHRGHHRLDRRRDPSHHDGRGRTH